MEDHNYKMAVNLTSGEDLCFLRASSLSTEAYIVNIGLLFLPREVNRVLISISASGSLLALLEGHCIFVLSL